MAKAYGHSFVVVSRKAVAYYGPAFGRRRGTGLKMEKLSGSCVLYGACKVASLRETPNSLYRDAWRWAFYSNILPSCGLGFGDRHHCRPGSANIAALSLLGWRGHYPFSYGAMWPSQAFNTSCHLLLQHARNAARLLARQA